MGKSQGKSWTNWETGKLRAPVANFLVAPAAATSISKASAPGGGWRLVMFPGSCGGHWPLAFPLWAPPRLASPTLAPDFPAPRAWFPFSILLEFSLQLASAGAFKPSSMFG